MAAVHDAPDHTRGVQAIAHGRGQARGQPGVALGPGERAGAFVRVFVRAAVNALAGRVKAVAAGEVVNAGPGRHAGQTGAVVVAAAVVQVPAQLRVVQAVLGQPRFKIDRVLRKLAGRKR